MTITITNQTTLRAIKQLFNKKYKFLKLEFFAQPHNTESRDLKREILSEELTIADIKPQTDVLLLNIDPEQTVGNLEKHIWESLGIYANVFRRSGQLWLETTATDSWTLDKQNRKGAEMSNATVDENNYLEDINDLKDLE